MSRLILPARRIASFASTRRGSVLIMVIVILVLLALIGTAMMSTSRVDRVATQQHAQNTQIDLLVESVENMARAAIASDMYGANGTTKVFRTGTDYFDYDIPGDRTATLGYDNWLASRLPNTSKQWPWISKWAVGSNFESPYVPSASSPIYTTRNLVAPQFATIPYADGTSLSEPSFDGQLIAADADGDGIADSGLFRLPLGQLNGVTYYAAYRIVDNGSAINASTALSNTLDNQSLAGTTPVDVIGEFRSNVDLQNHLRGGDGATNFTLWRLGNVSFDSASNLPVNDAAANVPDFKYLSLGDVLENQIARRPTNPGYVTTAVRCQSLPVSESLTMAYKFCLKNANSTPSILESTTTGIPKSVYNTGVSVPQLPVTTPVIFSKPFTDVNVWYNNNFDFTNAAGMPMRSYLTSRNGVQNLVPSQDLSLMPTAYQTAQTSAIVASPNKIPVPSAVVPITSTVTQVTPLPKVSANTAPFNLLWRGFWNVMASGSINLPYTDFPGTVTNARMFTPSVRSPSAALMPTLAPTTLTEQACFGPLMLRAAIAATQTLNLRAAGRVVNAAGDKDYSVISRNVTIYDSNTPTPNALYDAMIYGTQPQPYITEVFADTDTLGGANKKGYVAIELYNPYPFDISLVNWQLAVMNRPTAGAPPLKLVGITAFAATGFKDTAGKTAVVPAKGYLVMENFGSTTPGANDATLRPIEAGAPMQDFTATTTPKICVCPVPNLQEVIADPDNSAQLGGELVLLRPRRAILSQTKNPDTMNTILANDQMSSCSDVGNVFNEGTVATPNLEQMIPADQFDFTNFALTAAAASPATYNAIHYVRENGYDIANSTSHQWKFVYPGIYTASAAAPTMRSEGVQPDGPFATGMDPWATTPPTSPAIKLGGQDSQSSYVNNIPPIQLTNVDFGGPNASSSSAANANVFPYGGFARNGDLLEIPFIGAYRLTTFNGTAGGTPTPIQIIEFNSISVDSTYARAGSATSRTDTTNDNYENLGRFCPMFGNPAYLNASPTAVDQYAWTSNLFKFFDVWTPADDYFPNVDPTAMDATTPAPLPVYRYGSGNGNLLGSTPSPIPYPVSNSGLTPADLRNNATLGGENLLPTEGRININTAPEIVLEALPMCTDPTKNKAIAQLIVDYRDGTSVAPASGWAGTPHGPFTSIADLNKVVNKGTTTGFQDQMGLLAPNPGKADGDITPLVGGPDDVTGDYEEKFLTLNRVSNLVTTRSDVYTVYVIVQGWQNVGTSTPRLVVQRRAALLVDRSGLTPTNFTPVSTNIPSD